MKSEQSIPMDAFKARGSAPLESADPDRQRTPLKRVLLLTCGDEALAVVQAATTLSHNALTCRAPLVHLHLADAHLGDAEGAEGEGAASAQEQLDAAIETAIAELAGQPLADALAAAGYDFHQRDEIALWVVVSASNATTPPDGDTKPPLADVLQSVVLAESAAWQGARLRAEASLFLLADPAQQQWAGASAQAWRQSGRHPIYIAGRVNRLHLRLRPEEARLRCADSLAALIWGVFPYHAVQQEEAGVRAVGGALWTPPLRQIAGWLAARSAREALLRLNGAETSGAGSPHPALSPLRGAWAAAWIAELRSAHPPAAPGLEVHPSWLGLRTLAETVATLVEQQQQRDDEANRRVRRQWLDRCLVAWDAALTAEQAADLAPASGLPSIVACRERLERRLALLVAEQAQVEDALAGAASRVEAAQQRARKADVALRATCERFPPDTLGDLTAALLSPWRWPGWVWAWLQLLPHQLRDTQSAAAELGSAVRDEANWHAVRQAMLALQQSIRRCLSEVMQIEQWQATLLDALAESLRTLAGACAPWPPSLLERLWAEVADARIDAPLRALLEQQPLAARASIPAAESVAAWVAAFVAHDALHGWGALDCLVRALTNSLAPSAAAADSALKAWLTRRMELSTPLWPPSPTPIGMESDSWLLLPQAELFTPIAENTLPPGGQPAARLHPYGDAIDGWLRGRPEKVQPAAAGIEAIMLVRWETIALGALLDEAEPTSRGVTPARS